MKCPDCGKGEIKQTESNVRFDSDGMPTKVRIRIGCNKCDYVEYEDFEDL